MYTGYTAASNKMSKLFNSYGCRSVTASRKRVLEDPAFLPDSLLLTRLFSVKYLFQKANIV